MGGHGFWRYLHNVLDVVDNVDRMDDERIVEVLDESAFEGDPDDIVKRRITPKALMRLYESLDSNVPNIVDRAIAKALEIDKRLARKDLPQTPSQTLVLNFDPKYLSTVGEGLKTLFGGGERERVVSDGLAEADRPRLHGSRVD